MSGRARQRSEVDEAAGHPRSRFDQRRRRPRCAVRACSQGRPRHLARALAAPARACAAGRSGPGPRANSDYYYLSFPDPSFLKSSLTN